MGAPNGYARPVQPVDGRMSSWTAHTNRGVPSVEPGTDYYTPVGTPVRAAASGKVVDVGDSIGPATGRYVAIDLDDGRRVRYLHLKRRHVGVGDRVEWGQYIADSGATGYGEEDWSWNVAETGGAHVHMTLWDGHYYRFGRYATLDPERYMAADQQTPDANKPKPKEEDEDEMKNSGVYYEASNNTWIYLLFNTGSGWYHEFSNGEGKGAVSGAYNNGLAITLGTDSWAKVTQSHAGVIKDSLAAVRRTNVTGSLRVDVNE